MIKILEQNKPKEEIPVKCTCNHCKSVLEVTPSEDCKYVPDWREGSYWEFSCPVCKRSCTFAA